MRSNHLFRCGVTQGRAQVLQSKEEWLVQFMAPWCGHCQKLKPEWEEAAKKLAGDFNFGVVDATQESSLAQRYDVKVPPAATRTMARTSHRQLFARQCNLQSPTLARPYILQCPAVGRGALRADLSLRTLAFGPDRSRGKAAAAGWGGARPRRPDRALRIFCR